MRTGTKRAHEDEDSGAPREKKARMFASRLKLRNDIESLILVKHGLDPSPASAHIINLANVMYQL